MRIKNGLALATLCFPIDMYQVLLAKKTRGIIGAGKLNGFGGGVENGESLIECCVRETLEESHLIVNPKDLVKVGIVYFHNTLANGGTFVCKVYIYLALKWEGKPSDGDGMKDPKWYPKSAMPWDEMMLADKDYLPQIFDGKNIIAHVYYGPGQTTLLRPTEVREVSYFSDDD